MLWIFQTTAYEEVTWDTLLGHSCLLTCQSNGRCDIIFTFPGWQWRSTSTSTLGWKDTAVMRWKLRWTRWLRMLVYHINGRILLRTCQVCLYACMLTSFWSYVSQKVWMKLGRDVNFVFDVCIRLCAWHIHFPWEGISSADYHFLFWIRLNHSSACGCLNVHMHCTSVSQVVIHCLGGMSKSCLINCPQSQIACEQNHWNMTFKVDLCWHFHYISTTLDAFWRACYEWRRE